MRYTYVASDNSAGDSTALGEAGQDIWVKKVIFGNPSDGKITVLHNTNSAYGSASGMGSVDSTNIAFKFTQATHAAGAPWVREHDFTSDGGQGLRLDGGSIHTDGSQVTVIWELAD